MDLGHLLRKEQGELLHRWSSLPEMPDVSVCSFSYGLISGRSCPQEFVLLPIHLRSSIGRISGGSSREFRVFM
jgi:hypothetical protein